MISVSITKQYLCQQLGLTCHWVCDETKDSVTGELNQHCRYGGTITASELDEVKKKLPLLKPH